MTTNIQNNFFLGGANTAQMFGNSGLNSIVPRQMSPEVKNVVGEFFKGFATSFFKGVMDGMQSRLQGALNSPSCPCHPPAVDDSCHPQGSLKTDDKGVITTPGGYKIESTAQYEWKVTGPDGKETRIWGDPHVDLGNDGGKGGNANDFEFKRDSTFVLGDGTKINVSTKPYNNMTVTSGLDIISGNDRVTVSGIDQGKGKVSDVQHDGFQHVNDFGGKDVLVQGKDVTEWSFQGKKILGSENGGESFKLGEELKPLTNVPKQNGGAEQWAQKLLEGVSQLLKNIMPQTSQTSPFPGNNPYTTGGGYNRDNHLQQLGNSFQQIGNMFKVMSQLLDLTQQLSRNPVYTAY